MTRREDPLPVSLVRFPTVLPGLRLVGPGWTGPYQERTLSVTGYDDPKWWSAWTQTTGEKDGSPDPVDVITKLGVRGADTFLPSSS